MPDAPVVMQLDCTRITQAVADLVNNAAKYSPSRSELSVVLKNSAYEATIRVRDSGPGIRPDQLPHLFDAFYTDNPENPRKQGLGTVLWLASRVIELHGGTLTVESFSSGAGVEFCIRLPLGSSNAGGIS